ncbi:hypothetical protein CK3_09240 [butyrate-producing bacterium SS3/4]|nr:hypothetical protein CK3_09240 [butyrate-producing bacterium SS3/4]
MHGQAPAFEWNLKEFHRKRAFLSYWDMASHILLAI